MRPRLIVSLVLIALLLVFAVQNATTVDIVFLFWRAEISRALLLFIVFVLGGTVGWFLRTTARAHKDSEIEK
jgi:putative membrane protein